jgi:tetratricopeptide (TPR) repeat protein
MGTRNRIVRRRGLLAAAAALGASLYADQAIAQAYQGCYVGGQRVADSVCNGGSGGGSAPDYSAFSGMGYALGQALGKALLAPPAPAGPSAEEIAHQRANNLNNQAVALAKQGRGAEALDLYRQALDAEPSNTVISANYYDMKAQLDFRAGRLDDALAESRRAIVVANDPAWVDLKNHFQTINAAVVERDANKRRRFAAGEKDLLAQLRPVSAAAPAARAGSPALELGVTPESRPVYREGMPRSYPDFPSYTKAQHAAHEANEMGQLYASAGNWGSALDNYRDALTSDPGNQVIRDNIAIAIKHLDAERAARQGSTAKAPINPKPVQATLAPASPRPPTEQVKEVLPQSYADCNAQFQRQTNSCQRPDGSWDRENCFNPAKVRFDQCVRSLPQ